jgi:hypothetical protein
VAGKSAKVAPQRIAEHAMSARKIQNPVSPRIRAITQVTCGLIGATPEIAVKAARDVVLHWLSKKQKVSIPPQAWAGQPFETDFADGRPAIVESFENIWALRYDNPDSEVPGRIWRTEIVTGWASGRGLIGVRLSLILGPTTVPYDRTVPRVVSDLVSSPGLDDYGYALSDRPWFVSTDQEVESLVRLLENPERTRPVYVVSEDGDGYAAVDFGRLASRTAGIAHVVKVSPEAGYALSDRVGRRLSIYNGAVRTYRPGFNAETSLFEEHPVATPEWLERRFPDRRTFVEMLTDQAIDASVSLRDLEERLPSFSRVRQAVASRRLKQAKAGEQDDKQLLALYAQENERLEEDRDAAMELAHETEKKLDDARADIENQRSAIFRLRARIQHLEAAVNSNSTPAIEYDTSLDTLDEWALKHLSGRVELLPRALRAASKSVYQDVNLVFDALILLANEYRSMRLGEIDREEFENACARLGVQVSPTGDHARLMQYRSEYEVEWPRGRKQLLDMHLKKGNDRDPRHCLRIYFVWDADSEQVVIGHLTDHLTNDAT